MWLSTSWPAKSCSVCARSKASRQARMGLLQPLWHGPVPPLQPLPVPHRPWSHISLDFITGLPPSKGNTVVLTVVDRFSKMTHFIPLPKLPSAKETAQVMISQVFRIRGLPKDIVSDRGSQFISGFWKEFCQLLGATVSLSSGYHPESNGQTKRLNQELETCLRCLVAQNQTTWSDHLTWVEYAHNSLPTAATELSPFQVVHGYQPPLFPANEEEVTVPSAHALARRCRKITDLHLSTHPVKKFGYPPKTCLYTSIPGNWFPGPHAGVEWSVSVRPSVF
ncbi:hypothetical protein L3Q82_007563 [Scortum barcoo]|uniref:Uncharacterized protein n=1 Tax=Scortum barcoo TaxID=214431 RepID=A0ACB8WPF1_9TELE|nr:hypothetical protein L3Q82_007563 [Scortum barcoo]